MALLKKREGNMVFLKEISPNPREKAQNLKPKPKPKWNKAQQAQKPILFLPCHVSSPGDPSCRIGQSTSSHQHRSGSAPSVPVIQPSANQISHSAITWSQITHHSTSVSITSFNPSESVSHHAINSVKAVNRSRRVSPRKPPISSVSSISHQSSTPATVKSPCRRDWRARIGLPLALFQQKKCNFPHFPHTILAL